MLGWGSCRLWGWGSCRLFFSQTAFLFLHLSASWTELLFLQKYPFGCGSETTLLLTGEKNSSSILRQIQTKNTFTKRFICVPPLSCSTFSSFSPSSSSSSSSSSTSTSYLYCAGGRLQRFDPTAYVEDKRRKQKENENRFRLVLSTSVLQYYGPCDKNTICAYSCSRLRTPSYRVTRSRSNSAEKAYHSRPPLSGGRAASSSRKLWGRKCSSEC